MPAVASSKAKRASKPGQARRPSRKTSARSHALNDALAEAAWAEADAALAEALADLDEVMGAETAAARRAALAMLAQSLARAGRKRGLTRLGVVGAKAPFSSAEHELIVPIKRLPKRVVINARGVARGGAVLAKPRVKPATRSKTPARKKKP